ncbi:hypothetical protein E2C01_043516 [Portunus trituberculatus]|uniref:Uncharacterized protein n=1 Tax=Portunus trituberculatus TaxID=210409 RepID=A0A5B7FZS8_PORTR|nr:hypothetical protein [Portunus trituberculatus]
MALVTPLLTPGTCDNAMAALMTPPPGDLSDNLKLMRVTRKLVTLMIGDLAVVTASLTPGHVTCRYWRRLSASPAPRSLGAGTLALRESHATCVMYRAVKPRVWWVLAFSGQGMAAQNSGGNIRL